MQFYRNKKGDRTRPFMGSTGGAPAGKALLEVKQDPPRPAATLQLVDEPEPQIDINGLRHKNGRIWAPDQPLVKDILSAAVPVKIEETFEELEHANLQWTGGKISKELSTKILSWMKKWGPVGETQGKLFYNFTTHTWGFEVFPQDEPYGMHTHEHDDDKRYDELYSVWSKAGFRCLGTIHHHCSTSAFQSSTDHEDESRFNGLHVTFGKMKDKKADVHARYVHKGTTYMVTTLLDQFFEDTSFSLEIADNLYPKEWDTRFVKRQTYPLKTLKKKNQTTVNYHGHRGYRGYGGYQLGSYWDDVEYEDRQESIYKISTEASENDYRDIYVRLALDMLAAMYLRIAFRSPTTILTRFNYCILKLKKSNFKSLLPYLRYLGVESMYQDVYEVLSDLADMSRSTKDSSMQITHYLPDDLSDLEELIDELSDNAPFKFTPKDSLVLRHIYLVALTYDN